MRSYFKVETTAPIQEGRDLIIYCTRRGARDRSVANEESLLAAIKQQLPSSELHVYTGEESVQETIELFKQASVVVGMHGAGLSHVVFSPPGTAVVEFLFMSDPPMIFWHMTAALHQHYVMLPLPQSWWLEQTVQVPVQDVLDALSLALGIAPGQCELGKTACRILGLI